MTELRTVWKFPLPISRTPEVAMPVGSIPLHVGEQHRNDWITLWAAVDPLEELEWRKFLVLGTGHQVFHTEIITPDRYIGTAVCSSGLVWHVFEMPKEGS